MSEPFKQVISEMQSRLEAKLQEVTELKKLINALCKQAGIDPIYPDESVEQPQHKVSTLRPDSFFGKPFATAVRELLEMNKHPMSAEEILDGLKRGGYVFEWKELHRLRNVAISLAKNTALFVRLPSGVFGIKAWYPNLTKKKDDRAKGDETVGTHLEEDGDSTTNGKTQGESSST